MIFLAKCSAPCSAVKVQTSYDFWSAVHLRQMPHPVNDAQHNARNRFLTARHPLLGGPDHCFLKNVKQSIIELLSTDSCLGVGSRVPTKFSCLGQKEKENRRTRRKRRRTKKRNRRKGLRRRRKTEGGDEGGEEEGEEKGE